MENLEYAVLNNKFKLQRNNVFILLNCRVHTCSEFTGHSWASEGERTKYNGIV